MADAARQIARLSMRNEAGTNALQRACEAAYDAQSLLDLVDSSDLEHTDTAGRTSLHTAAAEGLVAVMQRILSNKPELIGARTKVSMGPGALLPRSPVVSSAPLFTFSCLFSFSCSPETPRCTERQRMVIRTL